MLLNGLMKSKASKARAKTTREKWGGLTKVADECWVNIDKNKNTIWISTCSATNTFSYLGSQQKWKMRCKAI